MIDSLGSVLKVVPPLCQGQLSYDLALNVYSWAGGTGWIGFVPEKKAAALTERLPLNNVPQGRLSQEKK